MSHSCVLRAAMWRSHRSEGPHRSAVAVTLVTSQRADDTAAARRPFKPGIHYLTHLVCMCCHLHNKLSFDTIDDTTSHRVTFPPEGVLLSSRRMKLHCQTGPRPGGAAPITKESEGSSISSPQLSPFQPSFTFFITINGYLSGYKSGPLS